MMDDNRPESLKGANHSTHTFTHYCVFEYALKSYYSFLLENSSRSDNSEFVNDAIRTAIVLEDDATITINSANKSMVEWIKKDLKQKGCRVN
jgi:hypothetical protein